MIEKKAFSSSFVLVGIFLLLLSPSALFAMDYYVDGINGSDENDGSSESPWKTIGYAISNGQASGTDTIYIRYAVYNESLKLGYDSTYPALNFIGVAKNGQLPVISGDGGRHNITLKNFNGILQGLAVTGAPLGHGIDLAGESSSAKVLDCEIYGNQKGIHVNHTGTPLIAQNKIYENSECGVATMLESSATVDGNEIYENGSGLAVGRSAGICIPDYSTSKISNNIIRNNYNSAIIVLNNASPEIVNNTIAHHRGDKESPGRSIKIVHSGNEQIDHVRIVNNIIYDTDYALFSQWRLSVLGNEFNNYWQVDEKYFGFTEGNNEISIDPLFVGNYNLNSESLCIDAGTASGAPATDKNGVFRPLGKGVDLGAYEQYPAYEPPGGQSPPGILGFSPALLLLL